MRFKLELEKGLIRIPTLISGPTNEAVIKLSLDTGATKSVLAWDILLDLGYDPAISVDRLQLTTASGVEFVTLQIVTEIEAIGLKRRDFQFACHSFPPTSTIDGVLGLDFFENTRLVIDFKAGILETYE